MHPEAKVEVVITKLSTKLELWELDFSASPATAAELEQDFSSYIARMKSELSATIPAPSIFPTLAVNTISPSKRISINYIDNIFASESPKRLNEALPVALKEVRAFILALIEKLQVLKKRLLVEPEKYMEIIPPPTVILQKTPTPKPTSPGPATSASSIRRSLSRRKSRFGRAFTKAKAKKTLEFTGIKRGERRKIVFKGVDHWLNPLQYGAVRLLHKAWEKNPKKPISTTEILDKLDTEATTLSGIFKKKKGSLHDDRKTFNAIFREVRRGKYLLNA